MQHNLLTEVPPGLFDPLLKLQRVSLSQNPFQCDCRIQYLRSWLMKNHALVSQQPTCGSPPSVANKNVIEISDDYFASCGSASCPGGPLDPLVVVALSALVVLLLWTLRLAKKSTIILTINHREMELGPRWRRHSERSRVGSDASLGSEDLLPQVLDVLHKKHNIKIKMT